MLKKAHLAWLKKLQGVQQITRLKQCFLSFTFHIAQKLYEKIMWFICYLIGLVVKIVLYLHFFTWRATDFYRLKSNMNDGKIVFLTFLLIALTWNIVLLFSFWQKIISCFKQNVYYFISLLFLKKCFDHNAWNIEKR